MRPAGRAARNIAFSEGINFGVHRQKTRRQHHPGTKSAGLRSGNQSCILRAFRRKSDSIRQIAPKTDLLPFCFLSGGMSHHFIIRRISLLRKLMPQPIKSEHTVTLGYGTQMAMPWKLAKGCIEMRADRQNHEATQSTNLAIRKLVAMRATQIFLMRHAKRARTARSMITAITTGRSEKQVN